MSLQDKLDAYKAGFKEKVPAETRAVMERATADLRASGILEKTIKTGDALPPFELKNQNGEIVRSEDLLARGPLVVTFFRGVWCPYCNLEVKEIEAYAEAIRDAGASLVAISPQQEQSAQATIRNNKLSYDVLIDDGNAYARRLGTVFELPDDLKDIYKDFGIVLPDHNGDDSWTLPMPTRLVVAQDGTIVDADINPDYTVRPDPSETLGALKKTAQAA